MPSLPEAPAPVQTGTELVFRGISTLRGSRSVHPNGVVYRATLGIDGGRPLPRAELFRPGAEHELLVRFSRSVGLPQPVPDILGLAFRVVDVYGPGRHQDFLLVTSRRRPLARHSILPARSFFGVPFSCVLPYRIGGELLLVGALPATAPVRSGSGTDLGDLCTTADAGELRFRFAVAPLWGRWRPVGEIRVRERVLGEEAWGLRFNPWNTGGGIVPVGPLNGLRRPAYHGSQQGYPTG